MQVITGNDQHFKSRVIVVMCISNKLNRFISIPIETEHTPLRIFSDLFKKANRGPFDRVEFVVILVGASMIRQYTLVVLSVSLAVLAENVLDVPAVIELLWVPSKRFDCEGNPEVLFAQID